MHALRRLFDAIAKDRSWWWLLFGINLFGSLYGFWWYRDQLAATPTKYWVIVPDSPAATFLLTIWLGLLLFGFDWRKPGMQFLGATAFLANMKWGLWTATVLPQAGIAHGWEFDYIHLSLSHFAMWAQGMLYARYYPPSLAPALGALGWVLFQDLMDYQVLMTHTWLPYDEQFGFARAVAVSLSCIWGGFLVVQALRRRSANIRVQAEEVRE
jgi:uncharacterized membrane protein YpjA